MVSQKRKSRKATTVNLLLRLPPELHRALIKSADSRNPPRSLNSEITFLLAQGLNANGIVERAERSLITLREEVAKAEARGKALIGEITKHADRMDAAREKVEQAVAEAQAMAEADEKGIK